MSDSSVPPQSPVVEPCPSRLSLLQLLMAANSGKAFSPSMDADVLIVGSPVYYGNLTAETLALLERLLFPTMQYEYGEDGQPVRTLPKKKNCGLIITMNVSEEGLKVHYGDRFSDYGKYRVSMFGPAQKAAHREKQFPVDMKRAYELGRELCR